MQRDRAVNNREDRWDRPVARSSECRHRRRRRWKCPLTSRVSRRSGMHPRLRPPNFIYEIETLWTSFEGRPELDARSRGSNYGLRRGNVDTYWDSSEIRSFDLIALPFALSQLDGGRLFLADFRLDQPSGL